MIIKYSDTNENRIKWQHHEGEEWKTAELDELIEAYEREKTGKWIKRYRGHFSCSVCGALYRTTDEYGNIIDGEMESNNYCSNCGARMVEK